MRREPPRSVSRRSFLAGCVSLAAAAATGAHPRAAAAATGSQAAEPELPLREAFPTLRGIHLNAGAVHPPPAGAIRAMEDYIHGRARPDREAVLSAFGRLINAERAELSFVQSTTSGEEMAVRSLGIPESGGRIVTDALHFYGSFYLYNELEKAGMEVAIVPMHEDRIRMTDLEAAVNDRTKIVAISAISTVNGFQHELKAVAELAHAHGAYLYADAIHAVGTVPLDVKAEGIDFLAASSYKWLMGDMGTGFLYVRRGLIPKLRRPHFGYGQVAEFSSHALPYDPPGDRLFVTRPRDDATGLFATATTANDGIMRLGYTLPWLERIGIERIQTWRQPIIEHARHELRRLGLEPITPEDSTSPLLAFAKRGAREAFGEKLARAGVQVALSTHRLRVSVSIFNTHDDIDRLVAALS